MFSKSPSLLGIALLFLQMQSFVVARTCYAPDGTTAESRFMPCLGFDGVESMCCGTNSSKPDFCQPNGLCYYPRENTYWRNYCTDKTWSSPNCLPKDLCDSEHGGNSSKGSQVIICPVESGVRYCCGKSTSCCDQAFDLKPTLVHIGDSPTATVTATLDTTVTATAAAATSSESSSSSSKNVAIGVGVGIPLGILAFAMLGVGFWWGRRKARAEHGNNLGSPNGPPRMNYREADSRPVHELDQRGLFELPEHKPAI